MLYKFSVLILFIIVFISGCEEASEIPTSTNGTHTFVPAELGKQFQLKVSQTALISGEGIEIKFLKVTEDSRCPSDVVCIWAGQVAVMVNVRNDNQNFGDLTLINSAGNKELAVKNFDGFHLELIEVKPYPISTSKIDPSDYVITLIVTKSSSE